MKKIFNRKQHWTRVLVVFALVCTLPVYAYDYTCDKGIITGTKSSTGISYTLGVTISDLGAGSCTFDTTAGVTGGAPAGINISVSSSSASGTIEYGNDALPTSNFTISMNGKLIPPSGGSGGTQPTWGASGQARAPFYLTPIDTVVTSGTDVTISAHGAPTESTWSINSSTWHDSNNIAKKESAVTLGSSLWTDMGWNPSPVPPGFDPPTAGTYTITATTTESSPRSATTHATVVAVASVSSGGITSTTDTPGANETLYILKLEDSHEIISATPNPNASWPTNTPVWSGATGDGSTAYFPRDVVSSTADGTTVRATCGTSAKAMKIVVLDVETETEATLTEDRTRKNLGVGEKVRLTLKPAGISSITWFKTGYGTLSSTSGDSVTFTAHDRATAHCSVTVMYPGGSHTEDFSVIEPTIESAIITSENSFSAGTQGAGMMLRITVGSTDVSFKNVQLIEVPGPATNITGYFEIHTPPAHSPNPSWVTLNVQNQWADHASFDSWPAPWSSGGFQWDIPVQWRVVGSSNVGTLPNRIQTFSITGADGTSTVSKLGQSVQRTP